MLMRRPFTDALLALITSGTGKPCGDTQIPDAGAGLADPPYYLLYPMPATLSGAPYADLNEDATWVYQLTAVSGPDPDVPNSRPARAQAEWMADKARAVVLDRNPVSGLWLHPISVPGLSVMARAMEAEPGVTNDPADAIISYVQRFAFQVTAA